MPRRIAAVLALLLGTTLFARAQAWRAGIDPRVELIGILFRLAGPASCHFVPRCAR